MQNKGTKTLETSRLILRQFLPEDAEPMFRNWASDATVTEFLTWPPHKSVALTQMLINDWISKYGEPTYYNWGIEEKECGEVIGNISVVHFNEKLESADIGYCLGKAWWGQGIMPEALRAVIDYLLGEVELNRVSAYHDSNNPKSGRVMAKAGMKLEGVMRAAAVNNQGICDKVCYSILRKETVDEESKENLQLKKITHDFSVCKIEELTSADLSQEFCFAGKTDEELSLVCITENVPDKVIEREDGWKAFRIQGVLDFSLIGILAKIAEILAEAKIGIFVVSTYNTDYVLVKKENFEKALDILAARGYQIL